MADLSGQIGELRMVVEIKRKETGETETVELIGKVTDDGGDALDGSTNAALEAHGNAGRRMERTDTFNR